MKQTEAPSRLIAGSLLRHVRRLTGPFETLLLRRIALRGSRRLPRNATADMSEVRRVGRGRGRIKRVAAKTTADMSE